MAAKPRGERDAAMAKRDGTTRSSILLGSKRIAAYLLGGPLCADTAYRRVRRKTRFFFEMAVTPL
jgi:hypothetical protein